MSWNNREREAFAEDIARRVTGGRAVTETEFLERVKGMKNREIGYLYPWLAKHKPTTFEGFLLPSVIAALGGHAGKNLLMDDMLKRLFMALKHLGSREMAARFGVTRNAIVMMARHAGVKLKNPRYNNWTEAELEVLRNSAGRTAKDVGRQLGRTASSVCLRRRALGVRTGKCNRIPWEDYPEIDGMIKKGRKTYIEIAREFGHGLDERQIGRRALTLGVRRNKEFKRRVRVSLQQIHR